MEAKELRIGNFVGQGLLHTGIGGYDHYTVRELHETVCFFNESDTGEYYKDFKPIQLSENWLIKMGLEPGYPGYYHIGELAISVEGEVYFGESEIWIAEIFTVHSLQNLYFALTGEELILKQN